MKMATRPPTRKLAEVHTQAAPKTTSSKGTAARTTCDRVRSMASPLQFPNPIDDESREQLFTDFKALVAELEQDETTDKNLLSMCKALFAFKFGES